MTARPCLSLPLLLPLTLLASCSTPFASTTPRFEREMPTRACEMPPILDGSREACLLPPYAPEPEATALSDGTPIVRGSEGRRWRVTLPGDQPYETEAMTALLERLRHSDEALRFLNRGLYCRDPDRICFHLQVDLCTEGVEEVAARFLAALAADPELPEPGGELAIDLVGYLGPRCSSEEGLCEPEPFETPMEYDPEAERGPRFHLGGFLGGACEEDGDCMISGCGNRCMHWGCATAHRASTCEGYMFSHPTFCGCVEGQCGWFAQGG